jgi:fluoride ion exporter CrcB/FEX
VNSAPARRPSTSLWIVLLWALLGGLAGSAARGTTEWLCIAVLHLPLWSSRAAINVIGGLGMGWSCAALTFPNEHGQRSTELSGHHAAAAFFGGFTTVSGFAWDSASAFLAGEHARLAMLLVADGLLGIAACAAGVWLGRGAGGNRGAGAPHRAASSA